MKGSILMGCVVITFLSGGALFVSLAEPGVSSQGESFHIDSRTLHIQFWSDDVVRVTCAAAKTLTIGPRKGEFSGMLQQWTSNVVPVKANHGQGIAPMDTPDQVVKYNGTAVTVKVGG